MLERVARLQEALCTSPWARAVSQFALQASFVGAMAIADLVKSTLGTRVLTLVWTLAVAGIASKALYPELPKWATLAMTIGMGWLAVLLVEPMYASLPVQGLVYLLVGGLFFTIGGLIFGLERPNPIPGRFGFHEIWHCCVVAGAASHFATMCLCL